ncbi:MAG: TM0106 family RecB-like putative nuclease [Anaerolineaceae bacterium]|nr:TM0106 family RecB-like putative nuclease [Anaerolineaceae bacterium]
MNKIISTDVLVAYSQCPRKAYLLLCTNQQGEPHEYTRILQQQKIANRHQYVNDLKQKQLDLQSFAEKGLNNRSEFLVDATLQADGLEADCGLLVKVDSSSALGRYSYEPTIFAGTYTVTKEQRIEVTFAGYALALLQKKQPATGRIISVQGKLTKMKLEDRDKTLIPLLEPLREWVNEACLEAPPVILNKYCPLCRFRSACRAKAEQEDNLSLLDRVTPKMIRQYEQKGIFTVKQLSYLYKPRKRKKRTRNPPQPTHKIELQALAIRTEKIYLQELPELTRQPVELFLDLEGVPDKGFYYLIGLLVCEGDTSTYQSFWADSDRDEEQIWRGFLEKAKQYPDAPIYHYGSYEPRAIARLARRYETDSESLAQRLVNVNSHIYGKVYFPVRSNSLKAIGEFIGAAWTSPDASGLQSLVWRHHWDENQNAKYKEMLIPYNKEDCQSLKLLVDELSKIKYSAKTLSDVDFANYPKQHATETGKQIHSQFQTILKFAHTNYDKKIYFRQSRREKEEQRHRAGVKKGYQGQRKEKPKPTRVIQVPPGKFCPKHEDEQLKPAGQVSKRVSKRLIIDLVLTRSGIRKTVTEYVGVQAYCLKCHRYYAPPGIAKFGANQLYGHGFKAFVGYQRVSLRVTYASIAEVLREQFNEPEPEHYISKLIKDLGHYYSETERIIGEHLLMSPFIHADETPVNIRGVGQYVWVFTDGQYVIFKLQDSREGTIAHEFLAGYSGILISDFYTGYDSVECTQQKCWVHLIRDLNDDLWKSPFDTEYEIFASEVRSLIIPIMEAIQTHGLKKRNLNKFRKHVEKFYAKMIINRQYKSELVIKYQKRFIRYEDSLFTFLNHDGIPWHNNTAENAIRHLAIQRDISKSFYESGTRSYLILLGIRQTCRFQSKSFFKFLFSGETDIDQFQKSTRGRKV